MEITTRVERPDDFADIRDIVGQAFGQDDEARLVDALRAQGYVRASLVGIVDEARWAMCCSARCRS